MSPLESLRLGAARARLLSSLNGKILDLGCGTGVNFEYFRHPDQVVGCEPDAEMRQVAAQKSIPGLTLIDSRAENLELEDNAFDHVVSTLVLCSVSDLKAGFSEIGRVLKPGGSLHFLEHSRGEGFIGQLHDWCTPLWSRMAGGCHLNRRPLTLIQENGFELQHRETVMNLLRTPFYAGSAIQKTR